METKKNRPLDTEDKMSWCKRGEQMEEHFLSEIAPEYGLSLKINPEKQHDPYAYDFIGKDNIPVDLKYIETPFFRAGVYGFDPDRTITFNKKDLERYVNKYPKLWVLFFVSWGNDRNYGIKVKARRGIWTAPIGDIDILIKTGRTAYHEYKRRVNDIEGNARGSYLIDLDDLRNYPLKPLSTTLSTTPQLPHQLPLIGQITYG